MPYSLREAKGLIFGAQSGTETELLLRGGVKVAYYATEPEENDLLNDLGDVRQLTNGTVIPR